MSCWADTDNTVKRVCGRGRSGRDRHRHESAMSSKTRSWRCASSSVTRASTPGPATIGWHLARRHHTPPSTSTIWRVLRRRGFITGQPHKRPRSSWIRFEAELPNECWQADTTHWALADGTDAEILNVVDDHSRLLVASVAHHRTKTGDVVAAFHKAATTWGYPASLLTDNGAIFTSKSRNGRCALEIELDALAITHKRSRPYHPQTCGKVDDYRGWRCS